MTKADLQNDDEMIHLWIHEFVAMHIQTSGLY